MTAKDQRATTGSTAPAQSGDEQGGSSSGDGVAVRAPAWCHPVRLGIIAARNPVIALLVVLIWSGVVLYGATQISSNYSLEALFRSDTQVFKNYDEMRRAFPLSERDVLILVQSPTPFDRTTIEQVRTLHLDLQLLDAAEGVVSAFSIPKPKLDGGDTPETLIPDELPQGAAFERMLAQALEHPIIAGKLMWPATAAGQSMMLIVSLTEEAAARSELFATIESVTSSTRSVLEDHALSFHVFGAPAMQVAFRKASQQDRVRFNLGGFLVCLFLCLLFFRHPKYVLLATLCPALAVLWSFGAFGLIGFPISLFMNAIAPLIVVVGFADSMHLIHEIRHRIGLGDRPKEATLHAVATIGPACFLAALTTSIALLALSTSESDIIRDFAFSGAFAVCQVFIINMLLVPSVAVLLLNGHEGQGKGVRKQNRVDRFLTAASHRLNALVPKRRIVLVTIGLALLAAFGSLHMRLDPKFRLSEQVPDTYLHEILAAERRGADVRTSPVYVVVTFPERTSAGQPRAQSVVRHVHGLMADLHRNAKVWSLESLRQISSSDASGSEEQRFEKMIEDVPGHLRVRLLNVPRGMTLVTGYLPDLSAQEMRKLIAGLSMQLDELQRRFPDYEFNVTGLSVVAALHASAMIQQLNTGLLLAILVVVILIGIVFRSPATALLSALPNLFPVVASGALLYILAEGIDYAGIIALTVAFGLAVDDSLHFVTRFYREKATRNVATALSIAVERVAPVMIITTIVLICGIAITVFGQMPQTRTFGFVCIVTLIGAIVADLLVLPALLLLRYDRRSTGSAP